MSRRATRAARIAADGERGRRRYRRKPTRRVLAAMTKLYLERGGLPVPERIEESIRT